MTALQVVRAIAVVCSGFLAGIYFGYRVGVYPALQGLAASNFVQVQRVVQTRSVNILNVLLLISLVTSVTWLVMIWAQFGSEEFWLIAASCCGIALVVAMTRAVSIPLNRQLMGWSIESPPGNFRDIWASWDRINTIRTFVASTTLMLEAAAWALAASPT